jgi:hypothetical protein
LPAAAARMAASVDRTLPPCGGGAGGSEAIARVSKKTSDALRRPLLFPPYRAPPPQHTHTRCASPPSPSCGGRARANPLSWASVPTCRRSASSSAAACARCWPLWRARWPSGHSPGVAR